MGKYVVQVPFAGSFTVEVEASSEDEAIENALEHYPDFSQEQPDGLEVCDVEVLRHITNGNVCYAPCWDAEVVDYPEEDE